MKLKRSKQKKKNRETNPNRSLRRSHSRSCDRDETCSPRGAPWRNWRIGERNPNPRKQNREEEEEEEKGPLEFTAVVVEWTARIDLGRTWARGRWSGEGGDWDLGEIGGVLRERFWQSAMEKRFAGRKLGDLEMTPIYLTRHTHGFGI